MIQDIRREARKIHSCDLFTGMENEEELIKLFLSPQGQEFCIKNNFPDVDTFFKTFPNAEQHGIYINAGNITLCDKAIVALIGDTHATLLYSDPMKRHEVILMHGATADITADGWSVVFVTSGKGCKVLKYTKDNAKIL